MIRLLPRDASTLPVKTPWESWGRDLTCLDLLVARGSWGGGQYGEDLSSKYENFRKLAAFDLYLFVFERRRDGLLRKRRTITQGEGLVQTAVACLWARRLDRVCRGLKSDVNALCSVWRTRAKRMRSEVSTRRSLRDREIRNKHNLLGQAGSHATSLYHSL